MPNWCFADLMIKTKSTKDAETLEKEFEKAFSSNPLNADFGNVWLGNLLLQIGMPEEDVIRGPVGCRGSALFWEREEDAIHFQLESAWSPHVECVKLFVDHYVDDASVLYVAEEPGCQLYWTNDSDVVGTVAIDLYSDGTFPDELEELIRSCCDARQEDVVKALSEYLGHEGTFPEFEAEINKKVREINEDFYVSFNVYQDVPI